MDGFLLVNKPIGMTSHDVVYQVKRKLKVDKIGHTGTLDPFASGLLILCLGKATKLQSLFLNLDKSYEGTISFGTHYDTYDHTGKIVETNGNKVLEKDLEKALIKMTTTYFQDPPMYSARKHEGRKLYDLARQGKVVDVDPREVHIYAFNMTSKLIEQSFDFYTSVSKGTYIRSLAVDLAKTLDTFAHLTRLTRTAIGSYTLHQAKTIDELSVHDLISLETYFSNQPVVVLSEYMCKLVRNGVYLDQRQTTINRDFIVKDEAGHMIAFYQMIKENTYKPLIIF